MCNFIFIAPSLSILGIAKVSSGSLFHSFYEFKLTFLSIFWCCLRFDCVLDSLFVVQCDWINILINPFRDFWIWFVIYFIFWALNWVNLISGKHVLCAILLPGTVFVKVNWPLVYIKVIVRSAFQLNFQVVVTLRVFKWLRRWLLGHKWQSLSLVFHRLTKVLCPLEQVLVLRIRTHLGRVLQALLG